MNRQIWRTHRKCSNAVPVAQELPEQAKDSRVLNEVWLSYKITAPSKCVPKKKYGFSEKKIKNGEDTHTSRD